MPDPTLDRLIDQAQRETFSGWDFSPIAGRMRESAVEWDYAALIRRQLDAADAVLDLGTGGGEFLSSLAPLPARTVATEAYLPNVAVARQRLAPLGITVVQVPGAPDNITIAPGEGLNTLPFTDAAFPLVINRHESYYPSEVFRILEGGGSFLTQQVGGAHNQQLNQLLGAPPGYDPRWDLDFAARQLEAAGFLIQDRREAFPQTVFTDVGALVYYLKAVPWQISGFSVESYRDRLHAIHERIQADGPLRIPGHLFYLAAVKR